MKISKRAVLALAIAGGFAASLLVASPANAEMPTVFKNSYTLYADSGPATWEFSLKPKKGSKLISTYLGSDKIKVPAKYVLTNTGEYSKTGGSLKKFSTKNLTYFQATNLWIAFTTQKGSLGDSAGSGETSFTSDAALTKFVKAWTGISATKAKKSYDKAQRSLALASDAYNLGLTAYNRLNQQTNHTQKSITKIAKTLHLSKNYKGSFKLVGSWAKYVQDGQTTWRPVLFIIIHNKTDKKAIKGTVDQNGTATAKAIKY